MHHLSTHYPEPSFALFYIQHLRLPNDHLAVLGEVVLGNLEVERRRALSYAARDVVVGAVAGAEPAAEVAGLADGDTSEMGADTCCCGQYRCSCYIEEEVQGRTQHDQPLGLLDTITVLLRVSQRLPLCVLGLLNLVLGAVSDEDGLATPLDDDLYPRQFPCVRAVMHS
jgi:hypothetical protein